MWISIVDIRAYTCFYILFYSYYQCRYTFHSRWLRRWRIRRRWIWRGTWWIWRRWFWRRWSFQLLQYFHRPWETLKFHPTKLHKWNHCVIDSLSIHQYISRSTHFITLVIINNYILWYTSLLLSLTYIFDEAFLWIFRVNSVKCTK